MRRAQISEQELGDAAEDQRPNNDAADALLRCKQLFIQPVNKQLMVEAPKKPFRNHPCCVMPNS